MTTRDVGQALLPRLEKLCSELLPTGSKLEEHWHCDSIDVDLCTGVWHDKISGEEGNPISLIASQKDITPTEANTWAKKWLGPEFVNGAPEKNGAFDPLKVGFKHKDESIWRYGTDYWTYFDSDGKLLGYSVFFPLPHDKFEIIPLRPIGHGKWNAWKPTPIFNAQEIPKTPGAPVLIVGSERAAFAASKLFPSILALSWLGGPRTISSVDWEPIAGRDVILWPDNTKAGLETMEFLRSRLPYARVVNIESLPKGWDLEQRPPKNTDLQRLLAEAETPAPVSTTPPFRCLGNQGSTFFYLSHASGDIVHLKPAEHTDLNLQMIATDDYWKSTGRFWQSKSGGVDYKEVAKELIGSNIAAGHFDPERIRGLGCWLEGSDVIYHAGDCLYVNGARRELHEHKSKFIYPRRKSIAVNLAARASIVQGQQLIELCELLPWAPGQMSWAFAAMCFLGPICGALAWRPNLWFTGIMGSGKSWTYEQILLPIFGDACLPALSTTSSAGIRQALQSDAMPVIVDEIESKDERSQARIQSILELVRQSSSETGGAIHMGTPEGRGRTYRIRSCFIFSSIAMGAIEPADLSRFARLDFLKTQPADREARFDKLVAFVHQTTAVPAWCEALRARAIFLAPIIRAATATMQRTIAAASGDARKGQQYGTLAAGAWMLASDTPPTPEQAAAWAATQDWDPLGAGTEKDADPSRVIETLLQYPTSYEDAQNFRHAATVGELLDIYYRETGLKRDAVYDALMRLGVHPVHDSIDIATRHSELAKVYKGTPYANRWSDHLRRIEGWQNHAFKAPGNRSQRCIRIPRNLVRDEESQPDL